MYRLFAKKKNISKHHFIQFANNFQLAFRRHFSHSYHDCHDNEKLTQEIQNHLIAVKGSQKYLLSASQKRLSLWFFRNFLACYIFLSNTQDQNFIFLFSHRSLQDHQCYFVRVFKSPPKIFILVIFLIVLKAELI